MISTEFADGRIRRIALRGDAFVPVVLGVRGILKFNRFNHGFSRGG